MTKQDILDNKYHRDQIAQKLVLKFKNFTDLEHRTGLCNVTIGRYIKRNNDGKFCPGAITFVRLCHEVEYDPTILYKRRDLVNKPR